MTNEALERLLSLRLHQKDGRRSPHKPLLALLALGRLLDSGTSAIPWSEAEERLADLIAEFGPASSTSRPQSAAYPFTRLRSDGVWQLNADVPMDNVGPLRATDVVGHFEPSVEADLLAAPARAYATARVLATSHFPESLINDVLVAAGLDPELTLGADQLITAVTEGRRRSASWRGAVIEAWDRQCAFCGYDGQLAGASVGLDAAHVRWFAFGGPDELDNGLALCSLHHKLFDRGVLGLDAGRVMVSATFTARTDRGRAVYDLHGSELSPRPGTAVPDPAHVRWHTVEVFKGTRLSA
jgi:putative restriction endonuclease